MKRLFLALCFSLIGTAAMAQQDAQYSQYIFNGLYINPAYAGYKQDLYLHSFYRSQWTGFPGAPKSFSIAADGSVNDTKVGLGLLVASDNIGAQSTLAAGFNYAYHIQVGEDENTRLSLGLGLGFVQAGIDGTKLNAVQQGDSSIPTTYQSAVVPDGRAGIMFTTT